jgi:RHS repeat-associated protein
VALRVLVRVGVLSGLLVGVLGFGVAMASAEPLCTDTWVGPAEGRWETVADWSASRVPLSSDVVCIGSGHTVEVTGSSNEAGVLEVKGTLKLTGTLEVVTVLEPSSVASLTISNGVLRGAATVDVSSSLSWTEGFMSGSGSTVVLAGASASLGSGGSSETKERLSGGRVLVNEGTMTLSVGHFSIEESELKNVGTFKVNSEPGGYVIGFAGSALIKNTGTFERTEGSGSARVEPTFENLGTVYAQSGSLSFSEGGSSSGSNEWHAAEGKTIDFANGTFSLSGGTVVGSLTVESAKLSITGVGATAATVTGQSSSTELSVPSGTTTIKSLALTAGGTLSGAGTLKVSSSLSWTGAELYMEGSGSLVVQSGATATLAGSGTIYVRGSRQFVTEGTTVLSSGNIDLQEHSELKNTGVFKANSEHPPLIGRGEESSLLLNTGTFEKTEGTNVGRIEPKFENLGTLNAVTGRFEIEKPVILQETENQYGGSENPSVSGSQPHASCGRKPVSCATGNDSESQTDFAIGGRGVGLDLVRTYNSQAAAEGAKGVFGYGWTSSFSDHLVIEKAAKTVVLHQADGGTVTFTEAGGEAFTAPPWTQDTFAGSEASGYTLTYATQTKYKFSGSSGRLESVTDRDGNATTLSYNEAGQLTTITDPVSRKIKLVYNSEGLAESAEDPMGHVVKYTYEGGTLKSVTQPAESALRWQFKYNGEHELTEMVDGRSEKTTIEYNGAHQVTLEEDPTEHKLKFEYEPFHTKITNENTGAVTNEYFTSNDEPSSITRGYGTASETTESSTYNEAGNLTSVTNGDNHTTSYGYNAAGDRTSETNPDNDETKWEYDSIHDVISTTTPKGETTTIKREAHGNPEAVERPAPAGTTQITKYKYMTHGELESVTNPLEHTWKYEYDSKGDRTAEIDPEGNKRTWEYNEDSQETATVSPRGNVKGGEPTKFKTTIERNAKGLPVKITDPLAHTTEYKYDGDGNIETVTDGNKHKTSYTYNGDNEPTKVKEANGDTTETEYDGAGQTIAQTDGNKHKTKFKRNALEDVTEVTDPLGHVTTKEYDDAGNLIKLTDPTKRTTTYTYDPANRVTEISYSSGTPSTIKYEYDKDGDRTKTVDATGTTVYTFDQLDRLTESENGHKEVVKYEYDLANDQTKITYPNGKAVTRAFDKDGRLEKVTDWLEHVTKFSYNEDSNLKAVVFPSETKDEDKYTYNDAGQMTEAKMLKSTETLASLVYTRDSDGQVKKTTAKGVPGSEVTEATYDEDDRLSKYGTGEYKYDAANNPTSEAGTADTFNEDDELEKAGTTKYSYDELGERTKATPEKGPATTYTYDQAGDLTAVERPKEGETPEIKDTYAYNGEALRVSETIGGTTSYLAWDMAELELPLILANGTYSFIYGPTGMPIEQINNSTGTVSYLHHDQAGSTRLLTGSTGTVTGKCSYSAYGTPTCEGTTTTPLGFDGQYTSSDTGLIYMRAREYDPATAQFLTVDPASSLTRAPYTYALDNPVNYADPSGLEAIPLPAPVAGGCAAAPEVCGAAAVGGVDVWLGIKVFNSVAGSEAGDEGEAELHAKEAERESECGKIPTGSKPPRAAYRDLEQETGLSRGELSDALHSIKDHAGLSGDANTRIDSEGNVYNEETGEWIGNIIDESHG